VISDDWQDTARLQGGLITRGQLAASGVSRNSIRHRVSRDRWRLLTPAVVCTTTGELSRRQRMWLGLLHAGPGSIVGDLTAAEEWGLRNWHRDEITVLLPHDDNRPPAIEGIVFRRSRRDLSSMRRRRAGVPMCRVEPAVVMWASRQQSGRTAEGVLAATVQQGLASPAGLFEWVDRLSPLPSARRLRVALTEIQGGSQSVGELDVRRMCRQFGLHVPDRQIRRRDASGRLRFTDCEWRLVDGRTLVLEVDGGFHMETEHWEDDIARQRALSATDRVIVHCTTRELRDLPEAVARDLLRLGVPRAGSGV